MEPSNQAQESNVNYCAVMLDASRFRTERPDAPDADGPLDAQNPAARVRHPRTFGPPQKVTDGVYQVRGFSISNMTIVEGATGGAVLRGTRAHDMGEDQESGVLAMGRPAGTVREAVDVRVVGPQGANNCICLQAEQ